jgi:hypothetical protein
MLRRIVAAATFFVLAGGAPAFAQGRVEASIYGGWNFSDGVSGDGILAANGNIYDRVDPKDSGSFGFSVGILLTENTEAGFMYGLQPTSLVLGGTSDLDVGDMSVTTYHGYFAYNFGPADSKMRPFVYGGLGATNFGSVDFTVPGRTGTLKGETQFSSTWGAGVKFFPAPRIGVRAAMSFTPTYIKSDAEGLWCDPFWGFCYVVADAQYSNQFGFSGGVTFRF